MHGTKRLLATHGKSHPHQALGNLGGGIRSVLTTPQDLRGQVASLIMHRTGLYRRSVDQRGSGAADFPGYIYSPRIGVGLPEGV